MYTYKARLNAFFVNCVFDIGIKKVCFLINLYKKLKLILPELSSRAQSFNSKNTHNFELSLIILKKTFLFFFDKFEIG
jgi:hypothetical protein